MFIHASGLIAFISCISSLHLSQEVSAERTTSGRISKAGPPNFREEHNPSYFEVPLFQKLKLRCSVTGNPKPTVEWFKSEDELRLSPSDHLKIDRHSLTIADVTESDGGLYFCIARNTHGEIRHNFTVKITEPYLQDEPEVDDTSSRSIPESSGEALAPYFASKMHVELLARPAGSSVVLKCPAASLPNPPVDVEWFKNGKVPSRELNKKIFYKRHSLIMDNLQLSDSGTFQCIISSSEGKVNFTYLLDIEERLPHRPLFRDGFPSNTTVHVGDRAVFECKFVSDLSPRMIWLKHLVINGSYADSAEVPYVQPLESADPNITDPHVLVLDPVRYEDEGFYTCLAGNSIGVSYRSAYLKVLPPPEEGLPKEKATLLKADNPSVIIVIAVFISATICVSAFLICRLKFNTPKVKFDAEKNRMVVMKKVILQERESPDTVVPFVKIDYNMICSTERSPEVEYELPLDPQYEFPRDRLKLGTALGEGAFAKVVRAEALGLQAPSVSTTVAVKMLKDDHTDSDLLALFSEIQLMKNIGSHVNILSLAGCCTQGGPLYAIIEFAEKGNLRDYLRSHRRQPAIRPPSDYEVPIQIGNTESTLSFKNLISFAYQTAKGMAYLISKGCIHRDLAARNILLTEDDVIKIGDFGLSRDLQESDYYRKSSNGKLPIKWMAPEALCERIFSSQSDVWSYGILLYEIFTLGLTPYPTISYEELYQKLKCGHRMSKPDLCPVDVYRLMRLCWEDAPKDRPSFGEIVNILDRILMNSLERDYLEFDLPDLSTPENSSSDEES